METTLTLTAAGGQLAGAAYRFTAPDSCVMGRSRDCDLCFPEGPDGLTVSRHHCRVELTPAGVFVHDLGSRNGTFLNGVRIGRRPDDLGPLEWLFTGPGFPLADGDELRVGDTVFRVAIADGAGANEPAAAEPDLVAAC
jgi:pSer/pThr/pTyr-binding forkhead associated (FHA) protein